MIIIVFIILVLLFGWFAIRWQIGNLLATGFTDIADENAKQIALDAHELAPSDPKTSLLLAKIEDSENSIENYKRAVRLSPSDYRLWIELARANEQIGKIENAESTFRQAVKLAPEYSQTHWYFGNFLLRQNRVDEAFAELKKSAESNVNYHQQVFSLAWRFFEEDARKVEAATGDLPSVRAGLAKFYAAKNRADDSLRVWNSLSDADKQANASNARVIEDALYSKHSFRAANEFARHFGIEPDAKAETIQNGDFEKSIGDPKDVYFGWKYLPVQKMDAKLDPTQNHEGSRSLRVTFNGFLQPTLFNITQVVAVEPQARYRLSFWLRTENLRSGGMPTLEVYNVVDDKNIVVSAPFPTGTSDWQEVKIEFDAPAGADAVALRTARVYCGDQCPIFGTFWYDDFRLEKLKQ